jgi:glutamate carboxypeptidase
MAATSMTEALGIGDEEVLRRVLERVRRYVEIETPSGDEAALNQLADMVSADAQRLGGRVERQPAPGFGTNLLIAFEGRARLAADAAPAGAGANRAAVNAAAAAADAQAPLVVLTHIDTVHPVGTLERQPFRLLDDRVEGPGVYDMKCGLALVLEALATLHERGERPARPVRLFVTCDEEIGSHSSAATIENLARHAAAVLVPEPSIPGGGVKTARKGVATYDLHVTGRAAHAGIEPGRAVSAITELALQIVELL